LIKIRDVEGYEGLYQITEDGRVWSVKTAMWLKGWINTGGYLQVDLKGRQKRYMPRIHRLVAEAFLPNSENKRVVNHKDGNKLNNTKDNLEWVSDSENITHAYKSGLMVGLPTFPDKKSCCIKDPSGQVHYFDSHTDLANTFNLDISHIGKVIKGKLRSYKGFTRCD